MKVGVYASMFGKDDPPRLESVESYIQLAYQLKLDVIDFHSGRGFRVEAARVLARGENAVSPVRAVNRVPGLRVGILWGSDADLAEKLAQARSRCGYGGHL